MSIVRRCDNPACVKGPAGTVQVSETANPAGWFVVSASAILADPATTISGDFCTVECAGQGLLVDQPFVLTPAPAAKGA